MAAREGELSVLHSVWMHVSIRGVIPCAVPMPRRYRLVSQMEISFDRLLEGNISNGMSHSASLAGLDTWLVICPESSRTVCPQPLVTFQ